MKKNKFLSILLLLFVLPLIGYSNNIIKDTIPKADSSVYRNVDVEAAFPGGAKAWKKFIESKLDASVPVKKGSGPGKFNIIIQFIVHKDGSISDITPLTNIGYGMEEEAMRVIKKSRKWEPATINGNPVNAYRRQIIFFGVFEMKK